MKTSLLALHDYNCSGSVFFVGLMTLTLFQVSGLFHGHCSSKVFQTLYQNLAWGLPIHTRFDDLDLVSRSQVCQNNKLQIVFLILIHCSIYVVWFLHTLKRWGTVCFVSDVYLWDITNTFFFQFCTWMWIIWAFCSSCFDFAFESKLFACLLFLGFFFCLFYLSSCSWKIHISVIL